jgi:hypothetical protein
MAYCAGRSPMRIRKAQVLALHEPLTKAFEAELFRDISTYFPERHTFLGDAHTRATIRLGIDSSRAHGLQIKRGMAMYVTLMFILGSYFGDNPLYPWARKILVDDRGVDEATRAHRFYNKLRRYLSEVRDENKKYIEPIELFPEEPLLTSSQARGGADLEEALLERLKAIAPSHVSTAGDESTRALIRLGMERAAHHLITSTEGLSMFVSLTFLLGLDFDQDPQFPWAAEALSPRADDAIESAALRLRDAALTFRRHTLAPRG